MSLRSRSRVKASIVLMRADHLFIHNYIRSFLNIILRSILFIRRIGLETVSYCLCIRRMNQLSHTGSLYIYIYIYIYINIECYIFASHNLCNVCDVPHSDILLPRRTSYSVPCTMMYDVHCTTLLHCTTLYYTTTLVLHCTTLYYTTTLVLHWY